MSRAGAPRPAARGAVQPRVAASFLLALGGVLAALGTVVQALGGPVALAAYALAVVALVGGLAVRARRLVRARERSAAGRTCTCCTTTHFDPVEVV